MVKNCSFTGHLVSDSPTQLHLQGSKTVMGNMKTHDHGCVFIKLYLQKYLQAIVC